MQNCWLRQISITNFKSQVSIKFSSLYRLQYCYKSTNPKLLLKMNEAFLRYENENEVFDISFRYVNENLNIDRQFNFSRKVTETVENFSKRIATNVKKIVSGKILKKQKKDDANNVIMPNIEIALLQNGIKVEGNVLCKHVLADTKNLKLQVFDNLYIIKHNVPMVTAVTLPTSILAGFPTYPSKFEAIFTDKLKSSYTWYKNNSEDKLNKNWTEVGQGYLYIPSLTDIGHKLKFLCEPRNSEDTGPCIEVVSNCNTEAGPGPCPFEKRHAFTKNKLSGKSFRVVCYNILANTYSETEFSKTVLFPYCPPYALAMDYRKQLIIKELIGYNSDIICLQEVDNKVYYNDLIPTLSMLNYEGVFNTKNEVVEGVATFFNVMRFEKIDFEYTFIGANTHLEKFDKIWSEIKNDKMKERFLKRNTTVQVTTLISRDDPSKILVVGNTHLYFKPDADHIRLLQGFYALTYVNSVATRIKSEYPEHSVSLLLNGDFNSVPECGIYQLMTQKFVPDNCIDWEHPEEGIQNTVILSHDLNIDSACGTPQFTNYTPDFAACLDYIFYQTDELAVEQVIPFPSADELSVHVGLPSIVFPSDHISLCADLKWKL